MTHGFQHLALLCLTVTLLPQAVKRVIDGDTFILYHVGVPAEERVRVLDIDTPEKGDQHAVEATQFTRDWLAQGPFVLTTCKRDSFGRLLAEVMRGSDSLADSLKAAGYAKP
jgi:Micrococcal nuclease (thermonuclease) homologs